MLRLHQAILATALMTASTGASAETHMIGVAAQSCEDAAAITVAGTAPRRASQTLPSRFSGHIVPDKRVVFGRWAESAPPATKGSERDWAMLPSKRLIACVSHPSPALQLSYARRSPSRFSRNLLLQMVVGAVGSLVLLQASAIADGVTVTSGSGDAIPGECKSSRCFPALSAEDRDALGRIAYAEAGNQGEEGLAAVLYAVLNRIGSGRFGTDVKAVIEAPGQFEPVDRVGGHWRNLPPLSARQQATIETILGLMQQGRLPDPTHGATFFQNPQIVAAREMAGQVRAGLTNFGNQQPIAVVRDHAFFGQLGSSGSATDDGPHARLVYPLGVTPTFRVERTGAGPHAVMYRIIPLTGAQTDAMRVGSGSTP